MEEDTGAAPDAAGFVEAVAAVYARVMVPLIFAEPAASVAATVASLGPRRVLETAAGTGVLTRELAAAHEVVASDLNPTMVAEAAESSARWLVADALRLPFAPGSFDAVVCQFGVMFFPDQVAGFAEAARVLRPGGHVVLTAWDRLEVNPLSEVVTDALTGAAADLDFLRRTPHGRWDALALERDLRTAGLDDVRARSVGGTATTTAADAAVGLCQGTPLRPAIEQSSLGLDGATSLAQQALLDRYGTGTLTAPTRWIEVVARRP